MKMTRPIDEDLLARAMEAMGAKTKTEAVSLALREVSRRARQKKLFATPIGTAGKAPDSVFDFAAYDALRAAESPRKDGTRRADGLGSGPQGLPASRPGHPYRLSPPAP